MFRALHRGTGPASPLPSAPAADATPRALSTIYFSYFSAIGLVGPFLALYLRHRGFSAQRTTYLLAALPIARLLATPSCTLLADALGSTGAVLRLIAVGALVSLAALTLPMSHASLAVALVAFTALRSPTSSLVDTLALEWARKTGGHFGRLRVFGTLGYCVATFAAGLIIRAFGVTAAVYCAAAALGASAVATFALPRGAPPARVALGPALRVLLGRPRFRALLAIGALHQVGMAVYDSLFPMYLVGLSTAVYAGAAVACGAASEVAFMTRARAILARLGLGPTLALGCAASSVRWLVMGTVENPAVLVAVQALHALSFAATYLAAIAIADAESPREVRASAQGIYTAATSGLACAASLALAGWMQPHGGVPAVFQLAAGASAVGAVWALFSGMRPARED